MSGLQKRIQLESFSLHLTAKDFFLSLNLIKNRKTLFKKKLIKPGPAISALLMSLVEPQEFFQLNHVVSYQRADHGNIRSKVAMASVFGKLLELFQSEGSTPSCWRVHGRELLVLPYSYQSKIDENVKYSKFPMSWGSAFNANFFLFVPYNYFFCKYWKIENSQST